MNAKIKQSIKNYRISIRVFKSRAAKALGLILFMACGALSTYSQLLTQETRQFSVAHICFDGTAPRRCDGTMTRVANDSINSVSHSNNFDGTPTSRSEARTAGRAGLREIAANATIRQRFGGNLRNYTDIFGGSRYDIDIVVLNPGDVYLDFLLPPGFVEIESNVELIQPIILTAFIDASLRFCLPAEDDCFGSSSSTSLFRMFSELEGGYFNHQLHNGASSINPSLDTSSLTHQNVSINVTSGGFIRTKTWEYPAFSGRVFLGHFNAGDTFTVSYGMLAEAYSNMPGFQTWVAAAINDPFFLSTDPLPQQDIFSFQFVPTPEEPPNPNSKVGVCHREGNGIFHLIRVASQAVRAHRAHGDALPSEDVPGRSGYRFDAACFQIPITTN